MPYAGGGHAKHPCKGAIGKLELEGKTEQITLYTTSRFENLRVLLRSSDGSVLIEETTSTSPLKSFHKIVLVHEDKIENLILEVISSAGKTLVCYQAEASRIEPIPEPAKAAKDPKEIASIEQLFLTGQHLEQYRHATYNPLDYYNEALQREPDDTRCN